MKTDRLIDILNACQALCEDSIKEIDRRLMDIRKQSFDTDCLDEKLSLLKQQRDIEHERYERKGQLFWIIDAIEEAKGDQA